MFSYSKIFYYRYTPITLGTIHIYDMYPLMIPIEIGGMSMVGLNLHWIPGNLRISFVNFIAELRKKSINPNMFRLYYTMIKHNPALNFSLVAIRRYIISHCTNIKIVDNWQMLPYISTLYKARYMQRSTFTPTRHVVMKSGYHQGVRQRR